MSVVLPSVGYSAPSFGANVAKLVIFGLLKGRELSPSEVCELARLLIRYLERMSQDPILGLLVTGQSIWIRYSGGLVDKEAQYMLMRGFPYFSAFLGSSQKFYCRRLTI